MIATLYEGLVALAPSLGARVGHAAATLDASGPGAALALLDTLASDPAATTYQPYWAVRAEVLHRAGRGAEAGDAYERAVGLSEDEATREFLRARAARPVG